MTGDHQDWVLTKTPPKDCGNKIYYFDVGGKRGNKDSDDVTWYRLNCSYWFGDWIEANGGFEQWIAYGERHRAIYIVREDLMTFIRLKWL